MAELEQQSQEAIAARATGSRPAAAPDAKKPDPKQAPALRKAYDDAVKALAGVPENAPNYAQLRQAKKEAFQKWFAADNAAKHEDLEQRKVEQQTPPPTTQPVRTATVGTVRAAARPQA